MLTSEFYAAVEFCAVMEMLEPKKYADFTSWCELTKYQQIATENSFGLTHAMGGRSIPASAIAEKERGTFEDSTFFAPGGEEIEKLLLHTVVSCFRRTLHLKIGEHGQIWLQPVQGGKKLNN